MLNESQARMVQALNRLTKWRNVFVMWQLGKSAPKRDAEARAVEDHREVTMIMRAELNAMLRVLLDKGVITMAEWEVILTEEAQHLSEAYAKKFPGFRATDQGLDVNLAIAADTMAGWRD